MIPDETKELLNAKAIAVYFGTRNNDLQPFLAPAYGVQMDEKKNELTVYTEHMALEMHQPNLTENGRVAIVVANPANHYTNQFKGSYVSAERCTAEETEFAKTSLQDFKDLLIMFYGEQMRDTMQSMQINQCSKFTMKIEEIFDQTPGPGAGKLINK